MQWIDVADTAVKIGLGAIISSVATSIATEKTHSRELQKIAYVRRLESLEQISEKAEQHFTAWRNLTSKLGGIYSGRQPPNPDFSVNQWKHILSRDKNLLETREEMNLAIARLRLLSATEAATRLSDYASSIGDFRNNLILKRKTPTEEEFKRVRNEASSCIIEFHKAMSKTYSSSQSASR